MKRYKKYPEEVTLTTKYNRFKVFTSDGEEIITFEKPKSPSEASAFLSRKVIGIIGID
jgi:hypothetical protein